MSAAAQVMVAKGRQSLAKKDSSKSLRVNDPNDFYELEADKVADEVVAGGRISHWSLSSNSAGHIQRDSNAGAAAPVAPPVRQIGDPQDPPQSNNYGDMLGKLADAFLKTDAGKAIAEYLKAQSEVKTARDFVETPGGIVVAGSTAVAAIAGLAVAHKGLPMQLPAIPLDKVYPGLKMKVDFEGPVDHPVAGSLVFSFAGSNPKKKKDALNKSEKLRAGTAQIQADQDAFKVGMGAQPLGPVPSQADQKRQAEEQQAKHAELRRMSSNLQPGGKHTPGAFTPLVPSTQPMGLRMRDNFPEKDDEGKKEEIPIQRKADDGQRVAPDADEVDAVIHSGGRALDSETQRSMESRIGFDFSRVRIHTDARAAASAKSLGARAYTVGSSIVFGSGRFALQTKEGRRLLAHELTHVVQQTPASASSRSMVVAPAVTVSRAPRLIQRDADEDAKSLSLSDLKSPIEALKKIARRIPGYDLFTVIIGQDPISGTPVDRNATNLVGGFLKLIGKKETFDNLQSSGALDRAFDWLKNEINQLDFSIKYFKDLATDAINSVGPGDVFDIPAALKRIYEIFKPPLVKVKNFAAHVLNKVFEFIVEGVLEAAGATGVLDMLRKAGAAFSAIVKDPVGFLGHLVDALKKGFNQFKDNILEHLKTAVLDWIFGEIATTGIKIPKPFGISAIGNLLLQVLGLTYPKLRARLVKAMGGEEPVAFLETAFEFLTKIVKEGLVGAWNFILSKAENLIETVLSAIKEWAITKIVTIAVVQLVALFNPAGAIIKAIQLIYEALRVFIEKAKQIAALISAIADSLSEIAAGNITKAADFIESTMAKTLPIILNFLAGAIGLGGIGQKIRGVIQSIQDKVGAAVDKLFNYIVAEGRKLWEAGKGAVASVVEWWKARRAFKLGDESHNLYMDGDGDHPQIMVESAPTTLEIFLDNVGASDAEKTNILALAKKIRWRKGEVQDSKKGEDDGQANYDKLYEAISALKVKGLELPDAEIENSPTLKYGAGTEVNAFLSLKNRKGTSPNKRNDPDAWTDLGSIREEKSYVRGHLLNDRLGGLGEWDNMMPLTNTANGDFYRNMEQNLIEAVSTGKQLVWVNVKAKYNDVKIPNGGTAKSKEKAAESRLDKLVWSYGPATCVDGKWKKASTAGKKKGKGVGEQIESVSEKTTVATM